MKCIKSVTYCFVKYTFLFINDMVTQFCLHIFMVMIIKIKTIFVCVYDINSKLTNYNFYIHPITLKINILTLN